MVGIPPYRQLLKTVALSGAISIGVAIALITWGQYRRLKAGLLVNHTWEVLASLQQLEADFVRLQFDASKNRIVVLGRIERSLYDLQQLTQDNESQQQRVERIKILVQAEMGRIKQVKVDRDREIQQLIASAIQEEFGLLQVRETDREMAWTALIGCQVLSMLLVIVEVIWIVRLYHRNYRLIERQSVAIGSLAHDIRSPIASIHLSIEMLMKRHPEQTQQLLRMQKTCLFAISLIEDIRFFVDPRLEYEPTQVDVIEFCSELVETLNSVASDLQRPLIVLNGPESLVGSIDLDLVRRTLTNLLNNASNYSSPETPVELNVSKRGRDILFSILDRGKGIPQADRAMLFDAFKRGSNVGEIKGSGLGLAIVKRCIDNCGGRVWFEDREGGGTIFNITLPNACREDDLGD